MPTPTKPTNTPDPLAAPEEGGTPPGHCLGNFELQGAVAHHANGVVYRAWDHAPPGPWTDFFALARVARCCIGGMLPPPGGAASGH